MMPVAERIRRIPHKVCALVVDEKRMQEAVEQTPRKVLDSWERFC